MKKAAAAFDFITAAQLRDELLALDKKQVHTILCVHQSPCVNNVQHNITYLAHVLMYSVVSGKRQNGVNVHTTKYSIYTIFHLKREGIANIAIVLKHNSDIGTTNMFKKTQTKMLYISYTLSVYLPKPMLSFGGLSIEIKPPD